MTEQDILRVLKELVINKQEVVQDGNLFHGLLINNSPLFPLIPASWDFDDYDITLDFDRKVIHVDVWMEEPNGKIFSQKSMDISWDNLQLLVPKLETAMKGLIQFQIEKEQNKKLEEEVNNRYQRFMENKK